MEYKINKAFGNIDNELVYDKLEILVNEDIKCGWKPLGGISIISVSPPASCEGNFIEVWQPMIKEN